MTNNLLDDNVIVEVPGARLLDRFEGSLELNVG